MLAMDLAHGESNNIFFLVTVAYACYYSDLHSITHKCHITLPIKSEC